MFGTPGDLDKFEICMGTRSENVFARGVREIVRENGNLAEAGNPGLGLSTEAGHEKLFA
jgi:hypothetical protein